MRTSLIVVAVLVLVAAAPVATATAAGGETTPAAVAAAGTSATGTGGGQAAPADLPDSPPDYADPDGDPLGWENGYWYDEPVDVDQSDGLNDTELDAVVARSMARVERVRELEFGADVPVEVISRQTYSEQYVGGGGELPESVKLSQNVRFEALFFTGEDESALAAQRSTRSASVGGFYSPSQDRIVIVSENTTSPKLDEITLSQELFHALQDQQFDTSRATPTREAHNALDGVIEGDGNYVDYLYEQRCDAEWSCLLPESSGGGGGGGTDINLGYYLMLFQPYSDGPAFVDGIREAGGWEAVNALYEDPPASTEQTIHPELYGEDQPTEVTIEDTISAAWSIPGAASAGIAYSEFGEAGIFTMFLYPSYDSGQPEVILDVREFFNRGPDGELDPLDPYNYESEYSAGWDGDRLYPYVTDDSATTNETGYVWKSVWDSEGEAAEFIEGYDRLLGYHGAEERADGLYVIPDGSYADAFYVEQRGDTVLIVNGPTVEALSAIRTSADIPAVSTTTTTEATTTATAEPTTGTTTDAGTATTPGEDGDEETVSQVTGPGFGPVAAVLAVVLTLLVVVRRR